MYTLSPIPYTYNMLCSYACMGHDCCISRVVWTYTKRRWRVTLTMTSSRTMATSGTSTTVTTVNSTIVTPVATPAAATTPAAVAPPDTQAAAAAAAAAAAVAAAAVVTENMTTTTTVSHYYIRYLLYHKLASLFRSAPAFCQLGHSTSSEVPLLYTTTLLRCILCPKESSYISLVRIAARAWTCRFWVHLLLRLPAGGTCFWVELIDRPRWVNTSYI